MFDQTTNTEVHQLTVGKIETANGTTRGNQTRAANMLGINRGTLRKKLKKYGMN